MKKNLKIMENLLNFSIKNLLNFIKFDFTRF